MNTIMDAQEYNPNVDIVHSASKSGSWANSKSKRFSFFPGGSTLNPGPGYYN